MVEYVMRRSSVAKQSWANCICFNSRIRRVIPFNLGAIRFTIHRSSNVLRQMHDIFSGRVHLVQESHALADFQCKLLIETL